jgi:hypothetical protein
MVSPHCKVLIAGFENGYCYRQLDTSGSHFDDKPEKNRWSHPHDALQYAVLGGGEGRSLMGHGSAAAKPTVAQRYAGPLAMQRAAQLRLRRPSGRQGFGLARVERLEHRNR